MVNIDCYRVGLPPPSTAIQRKKYYDITMLRLSSGQVAIAYIGSPIQYQDLAQLEFIAHYTTPRCYEHPRLRLILSTATRLIEYRTLRRYWVYTSLQEKPAGIGHRYPQENS